ncbi:hypothetical protein J6590_003136 [Homalodisca vitripennis]|nr:hypothetical protein J6590_019548 [Homalodisca vitripennis]KAG8293969.1 hypothetical protein J6590_003136 [Homalodisca vitripennis]
MRGVQTSLMMVGWHHTLGNQVAKRSSYRQRSPRNRVGSRDRRVNSKLLEIRPKRPHKLSDIRTLFSPAIRLMVDEQPRRLKYVMLLL